MGGMEGVDRGVGGEMRGGGRGGFGFWDGGGDGYGGDNRITTSIRSWGERKILAWKGE